MPDTAPGDPGSGILQSLRNLAATVVALLRTRLELIATEIEEERLRLLTLLFWAVGALCFLGVGILLLVLLVVAAFWDGHRFAAIGGLAGLFLVIGFFMAMAARNRTVRGRKFLSDSLGELAKDDERLRRP